MMRGKLSTLSVVRRLLYADLLGAEAEVRLKKARAHAAGLARPAIVGPEFYWSTLVFRASNLFVLTQSGRTATMIIS